MTRVNVGIGAQELCDQHLIAEYRELPRCISHRLKAPIDGLFRLGTGHVKWCAQFKGSLAMRQNCLVEEMQRRGFKPLFTALIVPATIVLKYWTELDSAYARELLIVRINSKLVNMKRATWTKSKQPTWATLS